MVNASYGDTDTTAWQIIVDTVQHPINGRIGRLLRNRRTGIYVLSQGQHIMSVPPAWAARQHAEVL